MPVGQDAVAEEEAKLEGLELSKIREDVGRELSLGSCLNSSHDERAEKLRLALRLNVAKLTIKEL